MEALQDALAGEGLAVESIPGKGRGLVTTRDFSPGDVIIFQDPYASTPNRLSEGSSCDGCFASCGLRRCSGCRIAWYCGNACQKSEWKLHQLECRYLAELSEDRRKMLTPSIRLMMRLLLRRKLEEEQAIPTSATNNYNLVDLLVSHMSELEEKQLVLYAQMAYLVSLVLPEMDINLKEVAQNFSKLACNAHTICDSELRPLGTGLYPVISIINHSCVPNSVLVFEGRTAFVRAVEPICKGTEVLISYIETAATTTTRQRYLEQYFFTCTCPRCIQCLQGLPEDDILEGYRCKDKTCTGFFVEDAGKKNFTCQHCGLTRSLQELKEITSEVEEQSEKAASFLSSGNTHEASILYKNVEQLQCMLCHSFSIKLMQTRETLLKILMELNDWKGALTCCRLTLPVYQRVYPAIHPMLGLQYYTCGKLECLLEYTEDAVRSFTKAVEILRITHGTRTPFMRELLNKLEEGRVEASYKHAGYRPS